MTITRRTTAALLGGVSLTLGLAGCSTPSTATDGGSTDEPSTGSTTSGDYADGTYSATGDYQSPGGAESIEVELTLADNVVTEVTVVGNATSGNGQRYQTEFEDGIADVVVGENIDELAVDKVAGSSLTSDGFNDAVEKIKADAAA
ncbi:MAG: hypothetical protein RI885_249 [Actinomycetota bacterium]|jgi:uncharacterized protein with FMN-binding domain